ncbi:MAG: hypothetical protein GF350_12630 [Chitinivibrionales bacterium]|nr:hypothetical protein [Chitinivibrionales bacterium]
MRTQGLIFFYILCTVFLLAAKDTSPLLKLDYSKGKSWTYTISYNSECIFAHKDKTETKNTSLDCTLNGSVSRSKDRLSFSIADVSVESELYDADVQKSIVDNLSEATLDLALVDGAPEIDTVPDFSSEGLPEWNIYIQFSKLLPDMPKQSIKEGFTWERSVTLPVKTAQGTALCEIYRLYKVENIASKEKTAEISWRFRYATTDKKESGESLKKYVPIGGKGTGTAVIDIKNKVIRKASVEFETPVAKVDNSNVNWKEKAELTLQ